MRRAPRFAPLNFFGQMLRTGGLNRLALLGTHRSASPLRLKPVYGQRDFGAGSRMKIGAIGPVPTDCSGNLWTVQAVGLCCLATILWPVELLGNAATKSGLVLAIYSGLEWCRSYLPVFAGLAGWLVPNYSTVKEPIRSYGINVTGTQ